MKNFLQKLFQVFVAGTFLVLSIFLVDATANAAILPYYSGGTATGVVPTAGAVVTGNGSTQCYTGPGTNGYVLVESSTAPCGVAWVPSSAAASSTIVYAGTGILVNASGTNGYVIINNGVTSFNGATGTVTFATSSTFNATGTPFYIPYWNATGTGLSPTSSLFISSSTGNVGIGTTSPAYALDMAAGDSYGYNGQIMANASTTLFNYFFGGAGNIAAAATGVRNTGVGYLALHALTTGNYNTANGYDSLYTNTTGGSNTANGSYSLYANTTGGSNTANGFDSLYSNTTNVATLGTITGGSGYTPGTYTGVVMTLASGSSATTYPTATIIASSTGAITSVTITSPGVGFKDTTTVLTAPTSSLGGTGSGFSVLVATLQTASNNTALGYQAGRYIANGSTVNSVSTNSVYLGYNAYPLADGDTNETVIGYGAVGSGSNTVTLGGTGTTGTIIPYGNVGIGTTSPSSTLDVNGTTTIRQGLNVSGVSTLATTNVNTLNATTSITNQGVKSALVLNNAAGLEGAYGGATTCANNGMVSAISATGVTTCISSSTQLTNLGFTTTTIPTTYVSTFNGSSGAVTGVSSITGTANQITASASTGAVTLSIPSGVLPSIATTTKTIYDILPATTDKPPFVVAANAFTIKRVLCYQDVSGDTVTFNIVHGTTNVFAAGQTCTALQASPSILTSFSSATVAAQETVYLTMSAASSSAVTFQIEY